MYRTCAIDGCEIVFGHCQVHHLAWYRNGGRTNIDNLIPLCSRHHHQAHEGGWQLTLDERRNLTITYPDGTTTTNRAPPARPP